MKPALLILLCGIPLMGGCNKSFVANLQIEERATLNEFESVIRPDPKQYIAKLESEEFWRKYVTVRLPAGVSVDEVKRGFSIGRVKTSVEYSKAGYINGRIDGLWLFEIEARLRYGGKPGWLAIEGALSSFIVDEREDQRNRAIEYLERRLSEEPDEKVKERILKNLRNFDRAPSARVVVSADGVQTNED